MRTIDDIQLDLDDVRFEIEELTDDINALEEEIFEKERERDTMWLKESALEIELEEAEEAN